jgi:hypothetical protein
VGIVDNIQVSYQGKDYIILHEYSSGFCEIIQEGKRNWDIKLVHFTELILIE